MTDTTRPLIALVVPAFNESETLPLLFERLGEVFDLERSFDVEMVIVDDHSSDSTPDLVRAAAQADARVRLVRLSRNCGSHAALMAGLAECSGDAAALMAADLQDPPELVPELVEQWRSGNDVVWAAREARVGEKLSVKLFSRIYTAMLNRLSEQQLPAQGVDFFLIDRKVIDAALEVREKNTSFMAIVLWMGFRQATVPYVKQARTSGTSKWTLAKKIKLFIDSVVSFSFTPIRAMSLAGVLFALAGFGFAGVVFVGRLTGTVVAGTGYAALMTVLLVGFGMVMMMLGVIGEYLWRTFDEARGRPRFLIEERFPPTGKRARRHSEARAAEKTEEGPQAGE